MRNHSLLVALAAVAGVGAGACAQTTLRREPIVTTGLWQPIGVFAVPGDPDHLMSVGKGGDIRVVDLVARTVLPTYFQFVPNVATMNEQGLYSIAFHPDYQTNGYFYVYYIRNTGQNVLARGRRSAANPLVAEGPLVDILVMDGAGTFHNGGFCAFGPDGYLYMGIGDNTTMLNGQNLNILRSKILRLDVDGPDDTPATADDDGFPADAQKNYSIPPTNPYVGVAGEDEIWASGFRNPWRGSFDRETGDLWIGDVGSEFREEISMIPAGTGAWNLGWPCKEGNYQLVSCLPLQPYLPPLLDFGFGGSLPIGSQDVAGFRYVCGGYVYRGSAMPCLRGTYIFADGASGIYSVRRSATGQVEDFVDRRVETGDFRPTAFGEGLDGELYCVHIADNGLYKLVEATATDCDGDGVSDACQISQGWTTDTNSNSIPDRCEGLCTDIDFNNDSLFPDTGDISDFLGVFAGAACPTAHCDSIDFNNDTLFPDTQDIASFLSVFGGGPCI